jgi:competence protein ComEA
VTGSATPPSRQRLLLAAWAMLVLGLAVRAFARGLLQPLAPPRLAVVPHRVDIDRAGVAELMVLPGIGRTRAEAIVVERVRHGPFRSVAGLQRVDGLGPAAVRALDGMVTFGSEPPQRGAR